MSDGWGPGTGAPVLEADHAEGARAPVYLLWAAAVSVAVSALLLVPGTFLAHVAGYIAGTVLTIGFVAAFRSRDVSARTSKRYIHVPWANGVGIALIVVGLLIALPHIWALAIDWSKV